MGAIRDARSERNQCAATPKKEERMESQISERPFERAEWAKKDFTERVRIATNFYVLKGLAYPYWVYLFHAVRLAIFIAGWMFFCSFTPGLGTLSNFTSWVFEGTAF